MNLFIKIQITNSLKIKLFSKKKLIKMIKMMKMIKKLRNNERYEDDPSKEKELIICFVKWNNFKYGITRKNINELKM